MVPWVGLRCVIVVFPDHTYLLFGDSVYIEMSFDVFYSNRADPDQAGLVRQVISLRESLFISLEPSMIIREENG